MPPLEADIRKRFREGDQDALREIVERYQNSIYRLGLRMLRCSEAAKDLAQDAFIHAYEKRHHYNHERPFEPWFYRVAMNLARGRLRRRKEFLAGEELPETATEPTADAEVVRQERRRLVQAALRQVGPKYREVLGLRFESELSLIEIGHALSISLGTVKSRLSRGLQAFHKAYAAVGGETYEMS